MPSPIRLGARVPLTSAEGPGHRYALWLQGCSIRCPGCCNPHLFDAAGGQEVEAATLLAEIAALCAKVEGVTLLGGEPFEQAPGLVPLLRGVRGLGLSVLVFSGYTIEELRARPDPAVHALLAETDVLVDGRYDRTRPETRRLWVGSANQRFHYLTDRYTPAIETPDAETAWQTVEVRIGADGHWSANGWPAFERGVRWNGRILAESRTPAGS
jgi:anaerobic ribonucleoside-triphosphate reductase activating protein